MLAGGDDPDACKKGIKKTTASDNKLAAGKKKKAAADASLQPSKAKGKRCWASQGDASIGHAVAVCKSKFGLCPAAGGPRPAHQKSCRDQQRLPLSWSALCKVRLCPAAGGAMPASKRPAGPTMAPVAMTSKRLTSLCYCRRRSV